MVWIFVARLGRDGICCRLSFQRSLLFRAGLLETNALDAETAQLGQRYLERCSSAVGNARG